MEQQIAKQYAQALFDLVEEDQKTDIVLEDMNMLERFMRSSKDFNEFTRNPTIPKSLRQDIIKNIFFDKVQTPTLLFLLFLEEKNRFDLLLIICKNFSKICLSARNTVNVYVTTRDPLTKDQDKLLKDHLRSKFKKDILTHPIVDQSVLGGIKIQAGDTIFNFTMKQLLEQFKHQLLHA